jgi:hypothetical protein
MLLTAVRSTSPYGSQPRWVPVYPIRRPPISTTRIQVRAIAAENPYAVRTNSILGGLHHEYFLATAGS